MSRSLWTLLDDEPGAALSVPPCKRARSSVSSRTDVRQVDLSKICGQHRLRLAISGFPKSLHTKMA